MERTQIYLSRTQAAALDREAKRRGVTRSHLIREAIEERYELAAERSRLLEALEATFGLWRDRPLTGAEQVEQLRTGDRWADLYPDRRPTEPDE